MLSKVWSWLWVVSVVVFVCWFGGSSASEHDAVAVSPKCTDESARKRVFITGITGMIGSYVAKALVDQDPCNVVFGMKRPRSDISCLAGYLKHINLLEGDLTDAARMVDLMREIRPQRVFHYGAQAINGLSFHHAELSIEVNVRGTLNLLEALRLNNLTATRVLLAGSSTEYGKTIFHHKGLITENLPLEPVSPYGVSKLACEKIANHYISSYKMPIITARIFIHIGVGGTDSLAINQFCRQIAQIELGLRPPVVHHGKLTTFRDITDAQDSAPAMIALLEKGVSGEAYNVGSSSKISIQQLLDLALSMSTMKIAAKVDTKRLRAFDEPSLVADISKLRNVTGWTPGTKMDRVVKEILTFWREKERRLNCHKAGDCK